MAMARHMETVTKRDNDVEKEIGRSEATTREKKIQDKKFIVYFAAPSLKAACPYFARRQTEQFYSFFFDLVHAFYSSKYIRVSVCVSVVLSE